MTTHEIAPFATLVVPESERELYASVCRNEIVTVPDSVIGLWPLRNWILERFDEECVVMMDDDVSGVLYLMETAAKRIVDPDTVYQIIANAYVTASDAWIKAFSFNQKGDVRKTDPSKPFILNSWGGCVVGVIGRTVKFCSNRFKVDVDFFLRNLLEHRIVLIDERYHFAQIRDRNAGGNSLFRTKEAVDMEIAYVKGAWGRHVKFVEQKGTVSCKLDVKR